MNEDKCSVSSADGIVTVTLAERLDSVTSDAVQTALMAELRDGARVVVDGAALTYMSAAGVRVLVDAARQAAERGARIALCRFTGAAADCLAVSGFAGLLEVAASADEAIRRLRPPLAGLAGERLHPRGAAG